MCGFLRVFAGVWPKKGFYLKHLLDGVRLSGKSNFFSVFWREDHTKGCVCVNLREGPRPELRRKGPSRV